MKQCGYKDESTLIGPEVDLEGIKSALRGFYEGLSEFDMDRLAAHTAPGYYLLEHGEYWDLDTTRLKIGNEKPDGFSRSNRFEFKRIEVFGMDAFAVWDLFATVVRERETKELYWLESGSFKKSEGIWKVHFLHSTRSPL